MSSSATVVIWVCSLVAFPSPLQSNETQYKAPTFGKLQLLAVRLCKSKIKFHLPVSKRRCRRKDRSFLSNEICKFCKTKVFCPFLRGRGNAFQVSLQPCFVCKATSSVNSRGCMDSAFSLSFYEFWFGAAEWGFFSVLLS